MIVRLAVCAAAAASLAGCALLQAADPQDLYTVTPKSTFEPDLPAVYWQLTVEAPAAAANLNTGRIAIAMTPTSSDYYAKAAWTDRAPLMVQTRIVDSFEKTRKIVAVARSDEHAVTLEGGRGTKTGQPLRVVGDYLLNPQGQPHSAFIATETTALLVYAGEPDEIRSIEVLDSKPRS